MLKKNDLLLTSEIKIIEFELYQLFLGDFNGVLAAGKKTQGIVPQNDHFPLVAVRYEMRSLQIVMKIEDDIDESYQYDQVIFV
jgi:hypothetical protein